MSPYAFHQWKSERHLHNYFTTSNLSAAQYFKMICAELNNCDIDTESPVFSIQDEDKFFSAFEKEFVQ